MSSESTARRGVLRTLWSRKWLVLIPVVTGAVTAAVVSAMWPTRYESHATIVVVPAQIGSDYVRPGTMVPVGQRLNTISHQILSRTRLERIVHDLNLYSAERKDLIMEDIINRVRNDISFEVLSGAEGPPTAFRVSFTGSEPHVVHQVANRISVLFIEESLRDRENMADATEQFLDSRIEDAKRRLTEYEAKITKLGRRSNEAETIEFDVLRDTFRSLLQKQQNVQLSANLERRQAGEQFKLLEQAKLPERPIGPSRTHLNLMGAGAGLVMGLVLVAAVPRRQKAA